MPKATFFTGQPVFNQLLSFIPRSMVRNLAKKHQTDRYCKKFHSYDHLVTMLFCAFHKCNCLREVVTGMQANSSRLTHLGLRFTPRRSTLADANERRPVALFEELFHQLYIKYYGGFPDSFAKKRWEDRLFIVDSTIISLFSNVMHSTGSFGLNGKKKGGIKAHVLMRAKDNVPCFVRLTEGKAGDSKMLDHLSLARGSVLVMDKGFRNFNQYARLSKAGINWVTRLHERTVYEVIESNALAEKQKEAGVKADQVINLGNPKTRHINPIQKARLIQFYDVSSQRDFLFLTNNMRFNPCTIADIYKKRWQIELFFKRIKQNFQLHYFLGDNENAIRIQLWCTLIADLLLKIIKDKVGKRRRWSMANLAGLVRLHLGTYINLLQFLKDPDKALIGYENHMGSSQMGLFSQRTRGA